jgi:hypothetical protein
MEDFTLPGVGGSLKKWVHCAPIFPKPPGPSPKLLPKKLFYKKRIPKILKQIAQSQASVRSRLRMGARALACAI